MSKEFPNKCNQCGFCCMMQTCPVGVKVLGVPKYAPCPALKWNGNQSSCGLVDAAIGTDQEKEAKLVIGIGTGCDISAKAVANGVSYDFASLPDQTKIDLAQRTRAGNIAAFQKVKP